MQALALSTEQISVWMTHFLWPFMRVSGLFLIAPLYGSRLIPVRVRVAAAFVITLMIYPLVDVPTVYAASADGLLLKVQQLAIGIAMGFIMQLIFAALSVAGENIAMTMGLGFAQMVDPQNGVQVPVISQFFMITATLIFLALDGHAILLSLLLNSFIGLPIQPGQFDASQLIDLVNWSGIMFTGGVLLSLPVIIALLAINFALGIMTRAAPQMNIFSVGLPATMLCGFILLLLTFEGLVEQFEILMNQSFAFVRAVFI